MLLVGAFGDDDLTPIGGADAQHVAGLGLADNGRLSHYSAFTVVAWSDEADFVAGPLSGLNTAYVIARGLPDDAVV